MDLHMSSLGTLVLEEPRFLFLDVSALKISIITIILPTDQPKILRFS